MSDDDSSSGVGGDSSVGKPAGANSQIEVYGRLRPSPKNDKTVCVFGEDKRSVEFRIPRDLAGGYINNKQEQYEFKMNHIFDADATQADIFDGIGKKVVQNVLDGFNGTIFAYGQTGSGKTFTITGGPDRYEDRGLIPRTLGMIFAEKEARANEFIYNVEISYLEIYNDDGYDLLDAEHETKSLTELPKVAMFEDDTGNIHMRNIHLLPANSVDEALNLLFVGDTNRVICETPSNDASSRSHCIFSIYVSSREVGGSRIRRSKLHLVDLAGSERVKKTQIQGKILTEACFAPDTSVLLHGGGTVSAKEVTSASVLVGPHGEAVPVNAVKEMPNGAMYRLVYVHGAHTVSSDHLVVLRWSRDPLIHVATGAAPAIQTDDGPVTDGHLQAQVSWMDRSFDAWHTMSFRYRTPQMGAISGRWKEEYEYDEAILAARVEGGRMVAAAECASCWVDEKVRTYGPSVQQYVVLHITGRVDGGPNHKDYKVRTAGSRKLGPVLPLMSADDAKRFLVLWLNEMALVGAADPLHLGDVVEVSASSLHDLFKNTMVARCCSLPLSSGTVAGSLTPTVVAPTVAGTASTIEGEPGHKLKKQRVAVAAAAAASSSPCSCNAAHSGPCPQNDVDAADDDDAGVPQADESLTLDAGGTVLECTNAALVAMQLTPLDPVARAPVDADAPLAPLGPPQENPQKKDRARFDAASKQIILDLYAKKDARYQLSSSAGSFKTEVNRQLEAAGIAERVSGPDIRAVLQAAGVVAGKGPPRQVATPAEVETVTKMWHAYPAETSTWGRIRGINGQTHISCAQIRRIIGEAGLVLDEGKAVDPDGEAVPSGPVTAAVRSKWRLAMDAAEAVIIAAGMQHDVDMFREVCLEWNWIAHAGAHTAGAVAYSKPADWSDVQYVYMLHSPLNADCSLLTADGHHPRTRQELEAAWRTLQVALPLSDGAVLLTELNPLTSATGLMMSDDPQFADVCLATMTAAVTLEPKVILAFGKANRMRWLADWSRIPAVQSGQIVLLETGVQIELQTRSGKCVKVQFCVHPSAAGARSDVCAAIAAAHGVPYVSTKEAWTHVQLDDIQHVTNGPSIAIDVDSESKRITLADRVISHNCSINLALHYLEQVIVALHKRSRDKNVHIPYRNSMMTSVLRDSLGGNCKTVMIATMSAQRAHLDESISTCRFAARVAMVRNAAYVNEEIDPKLVIRRLKMQVKELREELAAAQGQDVSTSKPLDEDELAYCRKLVHDYLGSETPAVDAGLPNKLKVQACFEVFKELLVQAREGATSGGSSSSSSEMPSIAKSVHALSLGSGGGNSSSAASSHANEEELKKLRLMVSSRDNEIAILVSMLKSHVRPGQEISILEGVRERARGAAVKETGIDGSAVAGGMGGALQQSLLLSKGVQQLTALHQSVGSSTAIGATPEEDTAVLAARLAAFEEFRRSYRKNQLIEEQNISLRQKIAQAQKLGEAINGIRGEMNEVKGKIEQRRLQRGVQNMDEPEAAASDPDPEEESLKSRIESGKLLYRSSFTSLKDLKVEIDQLKHLIERSRRKLQQDFETWWEEHQRANGGATGGKKASSSQQQASSTRGPVDPHNALNGGTQAFQVQYPSSPSASPGASPSPAASSSRASYPSSSPVAVGLISGSYATASGTQQQASSFTSAAATGARPSPPSSAGAPLTAHRLLSTGNAQADADIAKFYAMRDSLLAQQKSQQQR